MTIKVDSWGAWLVIDELRRRLATIDPTSGYNTRPTVVHQYVSPDQAMETQLPILCVVPVNFVGGASVYGSESFTEDLTQHVAIWGYMRDETDLAKATHALLIDVLEAVWSDETFSDNAILTNLARADFDIGMIANEQLGVVRIELKVIVQTERGSG